MAIDRVFVTFVVVNVLNTVLYYLLYLLFLVAVPYVAANVLALAVAVAVAYVMNARVAFQVRMTGRSLALFVGTNVTTIGLRTLVVWVLVAGLAMDERLAPLLAAAVTLPVAYALTKTVMSGGPALRSLRAAEALP